MHFISSKNRPASFPKRFPTCPECSRVPRTKGRHLAIVTDRNIQCAACGWNICAPSKWYLPYMEIPDFFKRLLSSMVMRNMMSIEDVDRDALPCSERAISKAMTIEFSHRELMMSGCMTWFEVAEPQQFTAHETDFAALSHYVPLVSALVNEFGADDFLVSEAPGASGRGLRNSHIRFLKYVSVPQPKGAPKHYFVRAFLTWDVRYRRTSDGYEKVAD